MRRPSLTAVLGLLVVAWVGLLVEPAVAEALRPTSSAEFACARPLLLRGPGLSEGLYCQRLGETAGEVLARAGAAAPLSAAVPMDLPPGPLLIEPLTPALLRVRPLGASAKWALGLALSVNSASAAEFESLPGIGPRLAARIVEDRTRRGPFADLADLDRVRGIGPASLARLAPYLEVVP